MIKILLSIFIVIQILLLPLTAENLDTLLSDYAVESDLSNKTKVKKIGVSQIVVYTREDLDRLHYQVLKDLFVLQRFYTYRENRFGEADFITNEPLPYGKGGQLVKIFIDDQEVSSPFMGSGIALFGDMELSFVDHIEVYEGVASYEFVTEPALLTIKLYSKTPDRDSGAKVGLMVDSLGSNSKYAYVASNENDIKYFLYASDRDIKREKINNGDIELSRDTQKQHFYGSMEYKKQYLTLQYFKTTRDGFLTNSIDATPLKDDIKNDFLHLGYKTTFFDDDSLELKVSYNKMNYYLDMLDDNPFLFLNKSITKNLSSNDLNSLGIDQSFTTNLSSMVGGANIKIPFTMSNISVYGQLIDREEDVSTISLKKDWSFDNHSFLAGGYIKHNNIKYDTNNFFVRVGEVSIDIPTIDMALSSLGTLNTTIPLENKLPSQIFYSIYLQDIFEIDTYNSIIVGFKVDREINENIENKTQFNYKISHLYQDGAYSAKTFYTQQTLNSIAFLINKTLDDYKSEVLIYLGHESTYKRDNYSLSFNYMHAIVKNMFIPTLGGVIVNSKNNYYAEAFSLLFKYDYSRDHSFLVESWQLNSEFIDGIEKNWSVKGVNLRILNRYDDIGLINEIRVLDAEQLIYDNGWQYNLSLTYQYTKDIRLFIKGENIFDSLDGITYWNYSEGIPSVEQKFSMGIDLAF